MQETNSFEGYSEIFQEYYKAQEDKKVQEYLAAKQEAMKTALQVGTVLTTVTLFAGMALAMKIHSEKVLEEEARAEKYRVEQLAEARRYESLPEYDTIVDVVDNGYGKSKFVLEEGKITFGTDEYKLTIAPEAIDKIINFEGEIEICNEMGWTFVQYKDGPEVILAQHHNNDQMKDYIEGVRDNSAPTTLSFDLAKEVPERNTQEIFFE